MKWFKHLSGSLNNSFIFELVAQFGGDGYMVFFGVLEMMSDEFNVHNPGRNRFLLKKITNNLQLSRQKTVKILKFCDEKARENNEKSVGFHASIDGCYVDLYCPKLKGLCDEYTAKILSKVLGHNPDEIGVESGSTPAQEGEGEGEYSDSEGGPPECPHKQIIALYHEILPELPRVRMWDDDRQSQLRARWRSDEKFQNLGWWKKFFNFIRECPFLMGKSDNKWTASLPWLVKRANFAKVYEGNYKR